MPTLRGPLAGLLLTLLATCGGGKASYPVPAPPAPGPAPAPTPTPAPAAAADPAAPALRLPDGAAPLLYIVELALDPRRDTFTGVARINVSLSKPADHVWLHGGTLSIDGAVLKTAGGEIIPARRLGTSTDDFLGIGFGKQVPAGQHWLEVAYAGKLLDNDYRGLFRQQVGEDWYVYSQFEATSARLAFPCFDEPRFKVPWTVSLHVPDGMVALSNTPAKHETAGKTAGTRTVVFQTSQPLPSYLVALAVGPFEVVDAGTAGRNKTPVRIITPKGRAARAAHARTSAVALQQVLEEYFDLPYPYEKLDHIAVPRFFGAMENPGLITYADSILLNDPGKEAPGWQQAHAGTVAHELAHQWFGDLVTLAWWDDTWLNESFATWAALRAVDTWKPQWQSLLDAAAQRDRVFGADSLITARQVRNPIKSNDDIAASFDNITYGKGAAVLWMFERWVGPEKFRDGIRGYLRAHAGKTATGADFLAAIGKVSRPEVPAAFATFIDQPGVPMVTVGLQCEKGGKPAVTLRQERFLPTGSAGRGNGGAAAPQRWHIPLCLRHAEGKGSAVQCVLFTEAEATVPLDKATTCPAWVLGNADGSGYYRVAYQGGMVDRLVKAGPAISVAERLALIGDLDALLESGRASPAEVMALAGALARDRSPRVLAGTAELVNSLSDFVIPEKLRPNYARFVRKTFGRQAAAVGWTPRKGEKEEVRAGRRTLLDLVAGRGEDRALRKQARRLAETWLVTRKGIDPDLLTEVLSAGAHDGDEKLYIKMLAVLDDTKDSRERRAVATALGSFGDWKLAERSLKVYLDRDLDPREGQALMLGAFAHPENRHRAYEFVKANIKPIMAKIPFMARPYISSVMLAFCDREHLDDARAFFTPLVGDMLGGAKVMAENIERVELCIARKQALEPAVTEFLRKQ